MLELLAKATRLDGSFDGDLLDKLLTVNAGCPSSSPKGASAVEMELRRQSNSAASVLMRASSPEETAAHPTLAM